MKQIALRLPDDMHAAVEEARGDVPREVWLRRAVEAALGHDGEASGTGRATRPEASKAGGWWVAT